MNKNLRLALVLVVVSAFNVLNAQATFKLQQTGYVGALTPDAAKDWTTGWTNFDPKTTAYAAPTDTITLNGMLATLPIPGEKDILSGVTLTLDATKVYLLKGFLVVRSGGKLVIPAGTLIRATADLNATGVKNYGSIMVERGGKIEVNGTSAKPVVITSANAVGTRDRGDWGGLVLSGKANHNLYTPSNDQSVQFEAFNNITFDSKLAFFGGTDVADNSGSISYLRLEFGGVALELNKEINGLTLGAVGSGTVLDHIQVSFSGDDSFEWFGGSVNSSYLIAWKGTDDDFDTDNGYAGLSQFGIGVRDSAYYDLTYGLASGGSTSEGFESDTEASGTADVTATKGFTNCVFSNFTMVGPVPVGSKYTDMNAVTKAAFRRGARLRRNSSQRIVNSIFMGYRNFCMIDDKDSSIRNTNWPAALALVTPNTPVDQKTKQIMFSNNLIVNTTTAFNTAGDTTANGLAEVTRNTGSAAKLAAIDAWLRQTGKLANNIDPVTFTAGTLLVNPSAYSTTPNFRPIANSAALSGANFVDNPVLVNLFLLNGANDLKAVQFAPIYPNPITNGQVNFGREVLSYGIFDIKGQLIQHGFDTDHATINSLAKGMYFIKLDGQVQKLIVQ